MGEDWRRRCEWCGNLLGEGAHARRMFCNRKCKNAYFNGLTATARAAARAKLRCQWSAAYWRTPEAHRERKRLAYRAKSV